MKSLPEKQKRELNMFPKNKSIEKAERDRLKALQAMIGDL